MSLEFYALPIKSGGSPDRFESGSALRLNEMVADGEADDVGQGIQVELAHHRGAMRLDRLDAEVQARRDGFVAVPLGQKLHDLAFARGEPLGPERNRLSRLALEESVQNDGRDLAGEIGHVARDALDGRNELARGIRLEQIAARARR